MLFILFNFVNTLVSFHCPLVFWVEVENRVFFLRLLLCYQFTVMNLQKAQSYLNFRSWRIIEIGWKRFWNDILQIKRHLKCTVWGSLTVFWKINCTLLIYFIGGTNLPWLPIVKNAGTSGRYSAIVCANQMVELICLTFVSAQTALDGVSPKH